MMNDRRSGVEKLYLGTCIIYNFIIGTLESRVNARFGRNILYIIHGTPNSSKLAGLIYYL